MGIIIVGTYLLFITNRYCAPLTKSVDMPIEFLNETDL